MGSSLLNAATPRANRMKQVAPGRAAPSQTLPLGEGLGTPGFPSPLLEGFALPNPPTGWGYGKTGFPHSPA